ncbi:Cytochrome b561 [Macleaya cordata]|uniref:Cytochrome b561 n=1 Tax=Macleaya cordata TaxID=56857 RepID=A0A200QLP0_MACCD|nr:Cytochrome b561 [Macleaya cordata]
MADSNPKISLMRFFCFFVAVILLWEQKKILLVVADNDDGSDQSKNGCKADLSKFLPVPYSNISNMACTPIWNTFDLRYFQSEDNVMTIVLSATYTTGWVGMGFSEHGMMVGSSAMIGWIGEESQASIKQFFLQDSTLSGVLPDIGDLDLTDIPPVVVLHRSTIYLAFQLNFASRQAHQSILLAFGTKPPAKNQLTEHDDRTTILFDFSAGTVSDDFKSIDTWKQNHRVFSIIGWGMLLPVGAIISRYFRHRDPQWFYLHASIQFVGFILGLATVVTGESICNILQADVGPHRGIGYFAIVLCILQVMAIFARPKLESKIRRYWNWYHIWIGRTALFLGSLNVVLGLQIGVTGNSWKIGYGILLAVILVSVILLEAFLLLRRHEKPLPPAFQVKPIP